MRRKLLHPPIIEAVLDLRVAMTQKEINAIKDFCVKKFDFNAKEIRNRQIHIDQQHGIVNIPAERAVGFDIRNLNGDRVIVVKEDGIVFSKIQNYSSFEEISYLYKKVINHFPDLTFSRLGLRYINKFDAPLEKLPKSVTRLNFAIDSKASEKRQILHREIFEHKPLTVSVINQIDLKQNSTNEATVILDIDVFQLGSFNKKSIDTYIKYAKDLKNNVFFNYIKDIREQFN